MEFLVIESHNLSKTFHQHGVNMRYLGKVAAITTMPSIKSLCVWEMIARSLKRMFNFELSNFVMKAGNSV